MFCNPNWLSLFLFLFLKDFTKLPPLGPCCFWFALILRTGSVSELWANRCSFFIYKHRFAVSTILSHVGEHTYKYCIHGSVSSWGYHQPDAFQESRFPPQGCPSHVAKLAVIRWHFLMRFEHGSFHRRLMAAAVSLCMGCEMVISFDKWKWISPSCLATDIFPVGPCLFQRFGMNGN